MRSVPGVSCRCSVAARAVSVRRGSTTMSDPRSRWSASHCTIGGIVSAQFEPQSISVSVSAMSETGKGRPRSTPNALFWPAAADAMQ